MKIIVAPDKFRGSLTAVEAAQAMNAGTLAAWPSAGVLEVPMADGGEGTVEAVVAASGGHFLSAIVTGPLGDPVIARYGMLGDGRTAVIEMAEASGLRLISADRRNPWKTTTRGTGELLLAAIEAGARKVVLGIGGSATNEGGVGMAQALGFRFLDSEANELGPGAGPIESLERIDASRKNARLHGVEIVVACDVENPLCGPLGASAIYGPQKGADSAMIERLDRNLSHLARIIHRDMGKDLIGTRGGGAAGGLGAGLMAFAGGTLTSGVELVLELVEMKRKLDAADLVLTGEGRLDGSSASGKTAVGVARMARLREIPVIALVGDIGEGAEAVHEQGIDAYFSICNGPISLEHAFGNASKLLENATREVVRAFVAARRAQGLISWSP